MPKARLHSRRYTKKDSLKKETFISNTPKNLQRAYQQSQQNFHNGIIPSNVENSPQQHAYQQSQQNLQLSAKNQSSTLSPSTSFAYTTVMLNILFYGIAKDNLQLIYSACLMAITLLGPPALKLLPLVKENFLPKDSKK